MKAYYRYFLPMALFATILVGSGIGLTWLGVKDAFYKVSPITAILPAIIVGWCLYKGTTAQKIHAFIEGVRHRDIITMCLIFLLAGGFAEITKQLGCMDAVVNTVLSYMPPKGLLISIFLLSAIVSTAIGTSVGTIAAITPIVMSLSMHAHLNLAISMATVVSGAMFGDNLSLISDTTLAAVLSQNANMRQKLALNAKVACVASLFTVLILMCHAVPVTTSMTHHGSFALITPYIFLMILALLGVHVLITLTVSIAFAGILGIMLHKVNLLAWSQYLNQGFSNMHTIMVLSLLIGGLSGLSGHDFAQETARRLTAWMAKKRVGARTAQLIIAKMVSMFDILFANNTIAIMMSGDIAKQIASQHCIPSAYSAAWLDIFSCVFQGILPYGAQILLASSVANLSPLSVVPHVYYCYALGVVAILHIIFIKIKTV
jgi:Na+/H+ antiporter NhaC